MSVPAQHHFIHHPPSRPMIRCASNDSVNLRLRQVGNLGCAILNPATGGLEAAQNARALRYVVVADQLVGSDAVERAVAY